MSEKRRTLAFVNSRFRKAEIASARGRLLFPVMIFMAVSLEPTCWAWPSGAAQSCTVLPSPLAQAGGPYQRLPALRSEEHTSELQSLMRISYAVFCLKKKKKKQ